MCTHVHAWWRPHPMRLGGRVGCAVCVFPLLGWLAGVRVAYGSLFRGRNVRVCCGGVCGGAAT